jgi:hypothetical protein
MDHSADRVIQALLDHNVPPSLITMDRTATLEYFSSFPSTFSEPCGGACRQQRRHTRASSRACQGRLCAPVSAKKKKKIKEKIKMNKSDIPLFSECIEIIFRLKNGGKVYAGMRGKGRD